MRAAPVHYLLRARTGAGYRIIEKNEVDSADAIIRVNSGMNRVIIGGYKTIMEKRGGIRMSAMEIALLVLLMGSLALGLLQAWQQEQMERALDSERDQ